MNIQNFVLVNDEKLHRARFGTVGRGGVMVGGVGENAADEAIIAEYDRLGGLILKDGEKVKTGSFYDFDAKAPRPEPVIVLLYTVNGTVVEVPDGAPLPVSVRAAQMLEAEGEAALEDEDEVPTKKKTTRTRKAE